MSWQLSCHAMCKNVAWSGHDFSNKSNAYFVRFGLWTHERFVKWAQGPEGIQNGSKISSGGCQGSISLMIFTLQFKLNGNSIKTLPVIMTTTKVCPMYNSCAVVACAKFCNDLMACHWITAIQICHHIWIVNKKSLVKWAPMAILEGHKVV